MSLPLLRPFARLGVVLLAVLTALAATVALAGSALAHVTVSSADADPGGYGKLTFRVPNESDTASTVALRIQFPEDAALASLRAQPMPGWTVTMTEADLAEPVESHGREITSYVSVVEFRAEPGVGIAPGEFQEFSLSGGPFPEADELSFPSVQTYSDGSEAAWIEPRVDGGGEPDYPAPVLRLSGDATESPEGQNGAEQAAGDTAAADDGGGVGVTALVLSIVALLLGFAGVVLGLRGGRRTVSS